ncbi:MAG TPA: AraC family transcriptional regulator ligand-binding domain-containing protein [Novosphingobium sp.]|nr:AraC family transcriptional regulator ligand-binding domain-containing protein [Novosphingobium sp.]
MNSTHEIDGPVEGDTAFDTVNADLLRGFAALCRELGGDPARLLAAAGIAWRPGGETAHGTYRQTIAVLADAAETLACPDFGMRLAARQAGTGMHGPLGAVMRHSGTLGAALDFATSHMHVHSRAARITRRAVPGRRQHLFSHELLVDRYERQDQAIELVILAGHLGAVALTGGRARARQVLFRHHPVAPLSTYRAHFGCEPLFDQPYDGIILSDADLASPVIDADPGEQARLVASVEQRFTRQAPPLHAAVRGAILRGLHAGACSNAEVAGDLGLHTRTLHRRLCEEGTSFQQIKDEVRREALLYYVRGTGHRFTWIADKLHFAEQSVMTRFCVRAFGMSPRRLREAALAPAGLSSENVKQGRYEVG